MLGTIIGDIIGSPYEFDQGDQTKDFPLFHRNCKITDDTVMTVAVLEALLDAGPNADDDTVRSCVTRSMKRLGKQFPNMGYGIRFNHWLRSSRSEPYNSCGNGSAMRVSPAGWLYDDMDSVLRIARLTAEVTHNHPEGITAFLEGTDFEDVIRTAVSLGGDCDTLTAIAGSIAEAFYGIPTPIQQRAVRHVHEDLLTIMRRHPLPHYVEL